MKFFRGRSVIGYARDLEASEGEQRQSISGPFRFSRIPAASTSGLSFINYRARTLALSQKRFFRALTTAAQIQP